MDTPKGGLFYTLRVSNILPGKAIPRLSVMSNVVVHPKTIVDHASGGASKPKLLDEVRPTSRILGTDHGFPLRFSAKTERKPGNRGLTPIQFLQLLHLKLETALRDNPVRN
jgi:hypothetical protein